MVVIEQDMLGVMRFRKGFFCTPAGVEALTARLGIRDVVRVYSDFGAVADWPYLVESYPTTTIRIDLTRGPDAVLRGARQAFRQSIKACDKLSNRIRIERNTEETVADFLRIYNSFARAKGRVPILSRSRVRPYLAVSDTSVLWLDGRPLAGLVTVRDQRNKSALVMFGASRRFDDELGSQLYGHLNRYIYWQELLTCCSQGVEVFDMGFLYGDPSVPFNQFKLSFGGSVVELNRHTFAGAGGLARLAVNGYNRLATSCLGNLVKHF